MQAPRPQILNRTRWIPAETWQRQGMTVQEMTLPLDVVIPTNSQDRSISLKAGQRVMVLKSPKGVYMQLENGKIIAIRSAQKPGEHGRSSDLLAKSSQASSSTPDAIKSLLPPNSELTITPKTTADPSHSRPFPWTSSSSLHATEMDPNSSNSGSSSSSVNHFMPFDNNLSAMEMLSSLSDSLVQSKSPSQFQQRPSPLAKIPSNNSSIPLPATAIRKNKFPSDPNYPFSSTSSFTNNVTHNSADALATFTPASSLRSSGGGIVATNLAEQSAQSSTYTNYPTYNQPPYSEAYSAFHRPEFPVNPSVPASHQYMAPYGSGANYYNPEAYQSAPPPYQGEDYTYQQQPSFNPVYNDSSPQNNHQFSQPPS